MSPNAIQRRKYVFSVDSPKVERLVIFNRRTKRIDIEMAASFGLPSFERATNPDNLFATFRRLRIENGQAPGIDGIRYWDLTLREVGAICRALSKVLRSGKYVPNRTIAKLLRKKCGGERRLEIGTVFDRVVAAAVAAEITPFLERKFLPNSFGFRPGYNNWQALLAVRELIQRQRLWTLAIDDIRQAFDFVPIDELIEIVRANITDQPLADLIACIARGHQGNNRKRGIDQGSPLSPVLLNLLLWERLDRPLSTGPAPHLLIRYADNLAFLVKSVIEGEQALERTRELLRPLGMQLKGGERPLNLRRAGAGVELLGFRIRAQGDDPCLEMSRSAWSGLREQLRKALRSPNPAWICNQAAEGWLAAQAPAFENADVYEVLRQLHRQASRVGVWELDSKGELESTLEQAMTAWKEVQRACRNIPADVSGHMEVCMAVHVAVASRESTRVPANGYAPSLPVRKPAGRIFC